jgi:hypothetical protein
VTRSSCRTERNARMVRCARASSRSARSPWPTRHRSRSRATYVRPASDSSSLSAAAPCGAVKRQQPVPHGRCATPTSRTGVLEGRDPRPMMRTWPPSPVRERRARNATTCDPACSATASSFGPTRRGTHAEQPSGAATRPPAAAVAWPSVGSGARGTTPAAAGAASPTAKRAIARRGCRRKGDDACEHGDDRQHPRQFGAVREQNLVEVHERPNAVGIDDLREDDRDAAACGQPADVRRTVAERAGQSAG